MEIPATHDEDEPACLKKVFRFLFLFLPAVLFISVSCKQPRTEVKKKQPVIDSPVINYQQQKQKVDSIAKVSVLKNKIYLTFDDGPNKGTLNVLNALKEDSVPSSFFIVGRHVSGSPEQTATWEQLQADSAIQLCNHSYSHALNQYKKYYRHPGSVVEDFKLNQQQLRFNNNLVRMPGRNAWRIDSIDHTDIKESKASIDSVHQAGFDIMGWDVEWMYDRKTLSLTTDTDLLLRQIQNLLVSGKTRTPDHLVLLVHDQAFRSEASVKKLHYLIQHLKNNPEYVLSLADSYPGIKKDLSK